MGIASTALVQELEQAIGPVLAAHGYELWLLEYVPRQHILRVYIDNEAGVTLDDCTRVSRLLSDLLDAEGLSDRIEGRYNLEVSSPGLDRPLVRPEHFLRYVGRQVQLHTTTPIEGRKKLAGELAAANSGGIEVRVDGKPYALTYGLIDKARLVPEL